MPARVCVIEDCCKATRSSSADLCPMHYHRQYRHGDVHKTATTAGITASKGRRYKRIRLPGHPLAQANGLVYTHRAVLYDSIGAGPHDCHWCGTSVDWGKDKGAPDCLNVDHLNDLGDDNRPENLVPSCITCNTTRGAQARARVLKAAGWWSEHDTIASLTRRQRRPTIKVKAAQTR